MNLSIDKGYKQNYHNYQLEQNKRGIYGGAIGYLDFTGNMDLCIGIRLAYKRNNEISICSGAGIVYDSVPENEYQECLNKASTASKASYFSLISLLTILAIWMTFENFKISI